MCRCVAHGRVADPASHLVEAAPGQGDGAPIGHNLVSWFLDSVTWHSSFLFSGLDQYVNMTPCDFDLIHADTSTDASTNAGGQARDLSIPEAKRAGSVPPVYFRHSRQPSRLQGGRDHTRADSQATVPQPSPTAPSPPAVPKPLNSRHKASSCKSFPRAV